MSDFVNSVDIVGDEELMSSIIDKSITEFKDDTIMKIDYCKFRDCKNLITVDCPNVTTIYGGSFAYCTSLVNVNLPNLQYMYEYYDTDGKYVYRPFMGCTSLVNIDLPKLTTVRDSAFENCTNLKTVYLNSATELSSRVFYGCTSLEKLFLLNPNRKCTYPYSSSAYPFSGTKINNGEGFIFVAKEKYEEYISDSRWSAYSNVIIPYTNYLFPLRQSTNILEFNGSVSIDISLFCLNENPVLENLIITSSVDNSVTFSDSSFNSSKIHFVITALNIECITTVNVSLDIDGETVSRSFDIKIVEELPTYSVEAVEDATYGFTLNDNGYYESTNKGVKSSYSMCKIKFDTKGICNLYLDCISSGESGCDYGILSNVDAELTKSNADDTSNVFKSFKSSSSTSVQTVDYGVVEEGEHFIYAKFIKDGSSDKNNDSLQFKVRFEIPE